MNKALVQRTICSLIFASLVTTQLSGMLSNLKPEGKVKNILLKKNVSIEHETIQSPHHKKDTFKIATTQQKITALSLSLIHKGWKKKNKDQEEETESDKKSKFNRKKTALMAGAVGAVGFFLYKNRDKFIPEVHCVEKPKGYGDLKPLHPGMPDDFKKNNQKAGIAQQIIVTAIKKLSPELYNFIAAGALVIFGFKMTSGKEEKVAPTPENYENKSLEEYDFSTVTDRAYLKWVDRDGVKVLIDTSKNAPVPKLDDRFKGNFTFVKLETKPKVPDVIVDKITDKIVEKVAEKVTEKVVQKVPTKEEMLNISKSLFGGTKLSDESKRELSKIQTLVKKVIDKPAVKVDAPQGVSFDDAYDMIGQGISLIVDGARSMAYDFALKSTWEALYNSGTRAQQMNRNLLLNIPEAKIDPKEGYITWTKRVVGDGIATAFNTSGDIVKEVALAPINIALYRKCLYWEWRSYEHCQNRFARSEYYNIKNKYAPELAKIKNIDNKIKYIKNHEDLSEATKKSSLEMLEGMKELEKMIRFDEEIMRKMLMQEPLNDEEAKYMISFLRKRE